MLNRLFKAGLAVMVVLYLASFILWFVRYEALQAKAQGQWQVWRASPGGSENRR